MKRHPNPVLLSILLCAAAFPARGGDPAMAEQARQLQEAFGRFEKEIEEARRARETEAAERARAETERDRARARAQRFETERERLAALHEAAEQALREERSARLAAEERLAGARAALEELRAGRDGPGMEAGRAAPRPEEAAAPGPDAPPGLHDPIPVDGIRRGEKAAGPDSSWDRVEALFLEGEDEDAARMARSLAGRRTPAERWDLLAQIEQRRGRPDLALQAMERAAGRAPRDPGRLRDLAFAYHAAGQQEAALKTFQRVVALDDRDGEAHFNLAVLFLTRPRPDPRESARHYERALRLGEPRDERLEFILFR